MSQRVQLPPGCGGFTTADGTRYDAKPGTSVVLEDRHAAALARSQHSSIGLVTAPSYSIGTKLSRWCPGCGFHAQGWSMTCPRCQAATISGEEAAGPLPPVNAEQELVSDGTSCP